MTSEDDFSLQNLRVAIIGLGLMGGSLALDLRGHCKGIVGVTRNPATISYALDHRIIDLSADFASGLECDMVILAAPVRTIIQQINQVSSLALGNPTSTTVVVDLGSTKSEIVRAMEALPQNFDPIGGHPLCGKEVAGIQHAEPGLYAGKVFILTPLERTTSKAMQITHEMISIIGAVPMVVSAERQDSLVANTSHLPYLLACALMQTLIGRADDDLWAVAASGFRDTSRLAASDLSMMMDIIFTNRKAILDALNNYRVELDKFAEFIDKLDEDGMRASLSMVRQQRMLLFNSKVNL
jgi:prephenate dehydrogenase